MQLTGYSILSDDELLTYTLFKEDATQLERELAQRLQLAKDERESDGEYAGRQSQSSYKEAA
jgi:hypothetical protein